MSQTKKQQIAMWGLFALFCLAILLLQDVILGKYTPFGAKFFLLPVAALCVAMHTDTVSGGWFCLLTALFWFLCGGGDAGLYLFLLPLLGCLCSHWCQTVLQLTALTASLLSIGGLLVMQCAALAVRMYLEGVGPAALRLPLLQGLLARPFAPVCHLCCRRIRKVGP